MEQSKALSRLLEVADLLAMLEDLSASQNQARLTPSVMSGMRLTIRDAREIVLGSHDTLASTLVSKSRGAIELGRETDITPRSDANQATLTPASQRSNPQSGEVMPSIKRNDLRASLDRIIER